MATYYTRPRHQAAPVPSTGESQRTQHPPARTDELPTLDLDFGEHSIYIFPNPSSVPPSPGSSLFSAPSDLPSSFSSPTSRSRTRTHARGRHPHSSLSAHTSSSRSGSANTRGRSYLCIRPRPRPATAPRSDTESDVDTDSDVEIELWDWTAESARSPADGSEPDSWVLEEEVRRASRWGLEPVDTHVRGRPFPLGSPASAQSKVTLDDARHRVYLAPLRSRTISRTRTNSANMPVPQPRIRIPFLSFFAALLSLDLDDPALRLLTQSGPPDGQSILFPGHSADSLFSTSDHPSTTHDPERTSSGRSNFSPDFAPAEHGLQKLLSTDSAGAPLRSLRAGFAIPVEVELPSVTGLAGLWRAVGEVYTRSGQAWKEVWANA